MIGRLYVAECPSIAQPTSATLDMKLHSIFRTGYEFDVFNRNAAFETFEQFQLGYTLLKGEWSLELECHFPKQERRGLEI